MEDVSAWTSVWEQTEERRPQWHPAYVAALAPLDREPAAVCYMTLSGATVLYPFWVGALNRLEFCPKWLRDRVDLVSPYGYGGPSYSGNPAERESAEAAFRCEFASACHERGVVAEFVREDIFGDHLVSEPCERVLRQQNVVVRLGLEEGEHLGRYRHKVRKNVRRAREAGLTVEFDLSGEHLAEFLHVYHGTMERAGASSYFMFSSEVFERLALGLEPGVGLVYIHVWDKDVLVSTELVLLSKHMMYSFLGGTLSEAFNKRPNDLLKHEAIVWGGKNGFRHFVLGGGVKPDDGIFRYKEAFDPGSTLPFFTRQRVHDLEAYATLTQARRAVLPPPQEGFFPEYRG